MERAFHLWIAAHHTGVSIALKTPLKGHRGTLKITFPFLKAPQVRTGITAPESSWGTNKQGERFGAQESRTPSPAEQETSKMPKSADAGSGWAGAGGRGRSRGKRQWLGAGQLLPGASKGEGSLSKSNSDWSRTLSIKEPGKRIHRKQEQPKLSVTTLHPAQISPNWCHWGYRHVGGPRALPGQTPPLLFLESSSW